MYSMSLLMDFKVVSDTDIEILKSIVGITKKTENNLRGENTVAVVFLESNTVDVGILDGNTIDVGVPIPEDKALSQVLHANNVGVVGVTQALKICDKGEKCALLGGGYLNYLCYCKAGGKSCHNLVQIMYWPSTHGQTISLLFLQ